MYVIFAEAPLGGLTNLAPSAGFQFFGQVEASARTRHLSVFYKTLDPA